MTIRLGRSFLAAAIAFLAISSHEPAEGAASARCDALKNEFSGQIRPHFLRVVNRNRDVGAYFRSELRRAQSGETPTRADIRKAYAKTRGACRNAACKTGAEAVYSATLRLYTLNRKWKNAGCPGYLKG
jgi:hypothetical protein